MKHFLNIFLIVNISLAQDVLQDNGKIQGNSEVNLEVFSQSNLIEKSNRIDRNSLVKKSIFEGLEFRFYTRHTKEKYSFDLVSSVGSNISFGGFWERYAIVNFTPQMHIRPVGFLSIYANHYLNCFIPMDKIKEYTQSIILQSVAVLLVDNSAKLVWENKTKWILELISFTAKNLILNFLIKPVSNGTNSSTPVLHFENYYCSIGINF